MLHYAEPPVPNRTALTDFMKMLRSPSVFCWTVRLRLNPDTLIGVAALHHHNPEHKSMEIGGTLLPGFWGQGIMQEAFLALMNIAKDHFQVNYIFGKTQSVNLSAIRLVEKLGFTKWQIEAGETVFRKQL